MQRTSHKNKKYSKELKKQAIQDYLLDKVSLWTICTKYGIRDEKALRDWIKRYNDHKVFKERSSAKGEIYMTKGRKTTQEERAAIVSFCIKHGKDYGLTVETYGVSYQQIYGYTNDRTERMVNAKDTDVYPETMEVAENEG